MSKRFAADTSVPVAKTRNEIEALITRYGATSFMAGVKAEQAMIAFEMHDRKIMFRLPLPNRSAFTQVKANHTGAMRDRTPEQIEAAWEQACRSRWRALLLSIKAKLEAVEIGIALFEDEFLANIMLADGQTVGEIVRPNIAIAYRDGSMPPLLPSPGRMQ